MTLKSQKTRKVAIVSDAIFPYNKGGKEIRYHELLRHLSGRGIQLDVFTMKWWDGPSTVSRDGITYHAICDRLSLYAGDRRSIKQALQFAWSCRKLLGYKYDIIDADSMPYLQLVPLRLVAWIKRVPLLVTWHEVWGADYWRTYLGRLGVVGAFVERTTLRIPDTILAASDATAERIAECSPKAHVISVTNGVDVEKIASIEPSSEKFDVVCVARLLSHKNVSVLLGALYRLRQDGIDIDCAIVGNGPQRDQLRKLALDLDLTDSVTFIDSFEKHDDVIALVKSSRVFVLPSIREGFGLSVLEAMACGVPVVTTSHRDNHARLLVRDGIDGVLCPPVAQDFARGIRAALEMKIDDADVSKIRTWADAVEELNDVYEKAV